MFIEMTMEVAPFSETKWLVMSSCLFNVPSFYAYYHELYFFSGVLTTISLVSANYWRHATYSWRRDLDLIVAKSSFILFSYNIKYIQYSHHRITGYTGVGLLIYCYYLSHTLYYNHNQYWVTFHVLFHLLLIYEQLLMLQVIQSYSLLGS